MVFSEFSFLFVLLPLFLALDFIVRQNTTSRNLILIAISLIFYAWGGGRYFYILVVYGVLNYIFGLVLNRAISASKNRLALLLLVFFISLNVFGLVYFKYLYWLVSCLKELFENYAAVANLNVKDRELPLGISFLLFMQ